MTDTETPQFIKCSCHGTPTPANLLDAKGRCLWNKTCDLWNETPETGEQELEEIEEIEEIEPTREEVLASFKDADAGRYGRFYQTNLPLKVGERRCEHCSGRGILTPSVAILVLVSPDKRLRKGELVTLRNRVRAVPVCADHNHES